MFKAECCRRELRVLAQASAIRELSIIYDLRMYRKEK